MLAIIGLVMNYHEKQWWITMKNMNSSPNSKMDLDQSVPQTYQLLKFMRKSWNAKVTTCAIFLDLAKAFETVSHSMLIKKLHFYRFHGHTNKLFESFLTYRNQYTMVGDKWANFYNITAKFLSVPFWSSTFCLIYGLLHKFICRWHISVDDTQKL